MVDFNVKANYYGNLDMLNLNAPLLHRLNLYEASRMLKYLAVLQSAKVIATLPMEDQPQWWLRQELPRIASAIIKSQSKEIKTPIKMGIK